MERLFTIDLNDYEGGIREDEAIRVNSEYKINAVKGLFCNLYIG